MALIPSRSFRSIGLFTKLSQQCRECNMQSLKPHRLASTKSDQDKNLVPSSSAKIILQAEFPNHYRDGEFVSRMSYVEFIDEALAKAKQLGLEKDLELYKELLRIFPPKKFWPTTFFQISKTNCHAPQQLAVMRLLCQMQMNGLVPDKDFEKLIVDAFSLESDVWMLIARTNYWTMKFRNIDENPLPEVLPKEPHKLAKLAIMRMMPDHKAVVTVTNTSNVTDSVDRTWIVSTQSPDQQAIIDRLDEKSTLYIEDGGLAFVGRQYLSYFVLKYYNSELKQKKPPDFNFNTMDMRFYGSPIKEKLESFYDKHYADGSYVLAICATGTSSQDSLLSWLKILQRRNPKLSRLNVVFKMSRRSPEIIEYQRDRDGDANSNNHEEAFA